MNLPFTKEAFFNVFSQYNITVWPLQYVFVLLAIIAVLLTVADTGKRNRAIFIMLSFFWFWMGIVYHIFFFATINKAAYLFGIGFIVQAILFAVAGLRKKEFSFGLRGDVYSVAGIGLIFFALAGYPVLAAYFGHIYPRAATFGLPCPTTIFTFGILLVMDQKCPKYLLIIPCLWALVGFTASLYFGVKEDISLLVGGIMAVFLISRKRRGYLEQL